jgi:hypothetical protein
VVGLWLAVLLGCPKAPLVPAEPVPPDPPERAARGFADLAACAEGGPLPTLARTEGRGEGSRTTLYVLGQIHDAPTAPGVRLQAVTTCQARIHQTIRQLTETVDLQLVAVEGVVAGERLRQTVGRSDCASLGVAGTYAAHLLDGASPNLRVTGWEDVALQARQARVVEELVRQKRRRRDLTATGTEGGADWAGLDDLDPWMGLAADLHIEGVAGLLLREDAWEHARSAAAVANTLAMATAAGVESAAIVIGSRHVDDLLAMGQTGRLAPRIVVYDCMGEP